MIYPRVTPNGEICAEIVHPNVSPFDCRFNIGDYLFSRNINTWLSMDSVYMLLNTMDANSKDILASLFVSVREDIPKDMVFVDLLTNFPNIATKIAGVFAEIDLVHSIHKHLRSTHLPIGSAFDHSEKSLIRKNFCENEYQSAAILSVISNILTKANIAMASIFLIERNVVQ